MAAATEWLNQDYYEVLGVTETATEREIRKAYRELARTTHPDSKPDSASDEQFKTVSAAYEVLGDPDTRQQYDQLRQMKSRSESTDPRADYGSTRFTNVGDASQVGGFGGLDGLFSGLFTDPPGYANHTNQRNNQSPHRDEHRARSGGDLSAAVRLPFDDAVFGTMTQLNLTSEEPCPQCGVGANRWTMGEQCPRCGGRRRISDSRSVKVRIPAGVEDGQTIRLPARGGRGANGGSRGDLYVTITVDPHPKFGRSGNDLTVAVPISYPEAALGADIAVPTLDGAPVTVRVTAGTSSGQTLRVRNHGVPKPDKPGDLLVTVDVVVPARLSSTERDLIQQLANQPNHRNSRSNGQDKS